MAAAWSERLARYGCCLGLARRHEAASRRGGRNRRHGQIALSLTGEHAALPLDGFFALHPSMPVFARLYKEGHAAVVHATATAYRERSHFDGQDVLESGHAGPGFVQSGWLNRTMEVL